APEGALAVSGNTKFDNLAPALDEAKLKPLRAAVDFPPGQSVFIAGSTHDGEVEPVLEMFARLREKHQLRLLIAPRYVDRATRIEQSCDRLGLPHRRRSTGATEDTPVVILDTIGELATAYALGDVVFVGGSFTDRGGQNILEPAVHGKPVVFGPHMENFADSVTLLLGRGGIQATTWEQLERVVDDLFQRDDYRRELGTLAKNMVAKVSGASERNGKIIADLLPPAAAS
ncbi:MAG: 3-deoxy-D-manno-octulosonic acid transferase, partial [Myxococcota bacterium]